MQKIFITLFGCYGHYELLEKIDFKKLNELYNETSRHLDLLNLKESVQNNVDTTNLAECSFGKCTFHVPQSIRRRTDNCRST